MNRKVWNFELAGQPHTLELEHSTISGTRAISVDNHSVYQGQDPFDTGTRIWFKVEGHDVMVVIQRGSCYVYNLGVDGIPVDMKQPTVVPADPIQPARLMEDIVVDTKQRRPRKAMGLFCQILILSGLIILVGVVLAAVGLWGIRQSLAVRDWPQSRARVVAVDTYGHTAENSPTRYYPVLSFQYAVNDQVYKGEETDYSQPYTTPDKAQAAYSPGQEVTVFYRPNDPQEAYLEREPWPGGWLALFFLGVFLACLPVFSLPLWYFQERRG